MSGHLTKSFSVFSVPVRIVYLAFRNPGKAGEELSGPSGVEFSLLCAFWAFLINFLTLKELMIQSEVTQQGKERWEAVWGQLFSTEIAFVPFFLLNVSAIALPALWFFRAKSDRLAAVSCFLVALSIGVALVSTVELLSGSYLKGLDEGVDINQSLWADWAASIFSFNVEMIFMLFIAMWIYVWTTAKALPDIGTKTKAMFFVSALVGAKIIEFPAIVISMGVLMAVGLFTGTVPPLP